MARSTRMWLAGGLAVLLLCGFSFNRTPLRDRWSDEELKLLASMQLGALPPAPADASNRFERSPAAAALGYKLFHDVRLSANGQVACATCHAADRQFQDGLPVSKGVGTGARRSMPVVAAAHSPWKFWDGRKDSLWSQALGPLEDAAEHATTRVQVSRVVRQHYRDEYESVFGRLPDMALWPADAGPLGTAEQRRAWAAVPAPVQAEVNRVFANVGKAIAAYERSVSYGASRFDRYVQATLAGDAQGQQLLSPAEVRGLRAFIGPGQCATCHNGPLFTDQHFHNTGVPQRDPGRPDLGRAGAIAALSRDDFNCLGPHSDADKTRGCEELRFLVDEADPALKGAFKTPSLRNVALRPPYMHAGQLPSLQAVVAHYAASPAATVGHSELAREGHVHAERQPIRLSDAQLRDLVSFLEALSGPVIDPVR